MERPGGCYAGPLLRLHFRRHQISAMLLHSKNPATTVAGFLRKGMVESALAELRRATGGLEAVLLSF